MKRSARQFSVEVVGSEIEIRAEDPMGERDDIIVVSPDQVVQLIEWFRDARDEIRGNANT